MKTPFDVDGFFEKGKIQNELDFERVLIAERKLRVMANENPKLKTVRRKLRDLIEVYENKIWAADAQITDEKLKESDWAEQAAEKERLIHNRRKLSLK